jgi:hypothetical protein
VVLGRGEVLGGGGEGGGEGEGKGDERVRKEGW